MASIVDTDFAEVECSRISPQTVSGTSENLKDLTSQVLGSFVEKAHSPILGMQGDYLKMLS